MSHMSKFDTKFSTLSSSVHSQRSYFWKTKKPHLLTLVSTHIVFLPPANEVCGKVLFLHVSVIMFTGEGSTWAGTPPGRYTPLGRYTPGQVHSPWAGTPLWVGTPAGQVHPWADTHQVHPPAMHAGIRSTSGRYASYWNAFLLTLSCPFSELCAILEFSLDCVT